MKKLNSIEVSFASSILYYDKQEISYFFEMYEVIKNEDFIVIDGMFDLFTSLLQKVEDKIFENEDPEVRKHDISAAILDLLLANPSIEVRESFAIWLEAVRNTASPFELTEDIKNHFLWEAYKTRIEAVDSSNMPFEEKIQIRPLLPSSLNQKNKIMKLSEITFEEEGESLLRLGLEKLDSIAHMKKGNFVVVAARPGVGKTLLMLSSAISNARIGIKTLFISLEMGEKDIFERILNYHGEIDLRGTYSDVTGKLDMSKFNKHVEKIKISRGFFSIEENLDVIKPATYSAESIINIIEQAIKESQYEVIYIDYLQLMSYKNKDEWSSYRALTKDLKSLASRTNTLIFSGSQVSRGSVDAGLTLADLFGSSTIENDTDIVYGLELVRARKTGQPAVVNVVILKNRQGDIGSSKYLVDYSIGRLSEST